MKVKIFFLTLFVHFLTFSQVQDDFQDNDFSNNPSWQGDDSVFTVIDDNGSLKLRSNKLIANTKFYLSTANTLVQNTQFEFNVRLAFNTSSTNFVDVYLNSDQANLLSSTLNGYFVRLGGTADEISLFKAVNGVETKLIDGQDGIISSSTNNNFKIKVICSASGDWSLERDNTGTGNSYVSEGSINDLTFLTGAFFGIKITQSTASFFSKHFFDNIYVGPIILDVNPPTLVSAIVIDATHVDLLYSENVEQTSAENVSNYDLIPFNSIDLAIRDLTNLSLVHLTTTLPLANGNTYTLTVTNVEDLFGNAIVSESINFTYLFSETPVNGDLIITEIFADPSPRIGLPEIEFVEIYNKSGKSFDLKKWKLADNSGASGTIASSWILPGEYKVLCTTSAKDSFPNTIGVTSFQSLNNSTDNIVLKDSTGLMIDSLTYFDTWYQDAIKKDGGYTLERINLNDPCSGADNWIASVSNTGGTPGLQNSVFDNTPDTQAPQILIINVLSANSILIQFSEGLDSLSLANAGINISPTLTINQKTINGKFPDKMTLTFNENLQSSQSYNITISAISDCWNNVGSPIGSFSLLVSDAPTKGDIIITEFFADPSPRIGLPEIEFVEIYNKSNKSFYLKKWKLSDNSFVSGTLASSWILPGEYKVLCTTSAKDSFPNTIGVTSFQSLNNSTDNIVLKDSTGQIIDSLTYFDTWYQDAIKKDGGYTLERINLNDPCSGVDNWIASVSVTGGTPGLQNSVFDNTPDTQAPQILKVEVLPPNYISIKFSEGMDSLSLANAIINASPNLTVKEVFVSGKFPDSMIVSFNENMLESKIYTVSLTNVADCWNNMANLSSVFVLADIAVIGDLVINEILFDPYTGASDFIEIRNNSSKYIDLKNYSMANYKAGVGNIKPIKTNFILKENEFAVITGDSISVKQNYPATVSGKFIQMTLPSYNNDSSTVYLLNTFGEVVDKVSYSDKWHFALLDNKDGKSLERIDPFGPSNDKNNWHTASENIGFATPGKENSQIQYGENTGVISISSQIISPDNDGFEDVLLINYEMINSGMLANITIYDDRGRLIKTIVKNQIIGSKGSFSWDGVTESNQKASIGTYVLLFTAFDLEGNKISKKLAFVVAGKL